MLRQRLWRLLAGTWPGTFLPPLLLSGLLCFGGTESVAQESAAAECDSVADAFFLLQFDYRVDQARWAARAEMDSLRIADVVKQVELERKQRRRETIVMGLSVIVAGVIFWLGGAASE